MTNKYDIDKENSITDEFYFLNRRKIMASILSVPILTQTSMVSSKEQNLFFTKDLDYSTNEETNTFKQITSYNNFYELGTGKKDPMSIIEINS